MSPDTARVWWQDGVVYQIYPRSFRRLERRRHRRPARHHRAPRLPERRHAGSLGVDAIWLSPIYPSPMADFGYDVSDYCDVDPLFGTPRRLRRAARRGARARHPRHPRLGAEPHLGPAPVVPRVARRRARRRSATGTSGAIRRAGRWRAAEQLDRRASAAPPGSWTRRRGQYYLHSFLAEQPDLNWRNPEVVKAAMHDVSRFWLDRGVDGFRVDVIHRMVKDAELRDNPPPDADDAAGARLRSASSTSTTENRPEVHDVVRGCAPTARRATRERMMVGEVYLPRTRRGRRRTTAPAATSCTSPSTSASCGRAVGCGRRFGARDRRGRRRCCPPARWPTYVLVATTTRRATASAIRRPRCAARRARASRR